MPELSRFYGIIIRMYWEADAPHHLPHFHVYYHEEVAVYQIDPIQIIAGKLPSRQSRLVEAWAEIHQQEIIANWNRIQAGRRPEPIPPLA